MPETIDHECRIPLSEDTIIQALDGMGWLDDMVQEELGEDAPTSSYNVELKTGKHGYMSLQISWTTKNEHETLYCDWCGDWIQGGEEDFGPENVHPVTSMPFGVGSVSQGESAQLCQDCFNRKDSNSVEPCAECGDVVELGTSNVDVCELCDRSYCRAHKDEVLYREGQPVGCLNCIKGGVR